MKYTFGFLSASFFLFASCSKEVNNPASTAYTYMNTSAGSSWNYHVVDNTGLTPPEDYTITSTSRDSSINSKSYHVYNNTAGTNQYLAISGHDYYQFDSLPAGLGAGIIERLYLKDNAAAGATWSQNLNVTIPGSPFPVPVTITNSITETGISRTVNGTSYSNVIHVSTSISSTLIPAASLVTSIDSYYALKYGLIENTNIVHLDFAGVVQDLDTETKLVSATLQ